MRWPKLPGSSEQRRFAGMVAAAVAGGLGVTYVLLPEPPPELAPVPAPPRLRVAGELLPEGGDPIANAVDLVRRYGGGELTIELPDGKTTRIKRGALGAEIDRVHVAEFVKDALRPGSPLQRAHAEKGGGEPLDVPIPISLDTDVAVRRLIQIKGEIDAAPADAFVDLEAKVLKPERIGYRLDVYGTLARIDVALRRGEASVTAEVETIRPKKTAGSLGNVKFGSVLGYFETRYSPGRKYADRTYNLRLAASKLDGAVVMPGEVFDFNEVVGPRDEASGYRVAPVIAQGELVDGLGGGTCQISGTLHGAALFAGLDIVERYPHSRPSYYIKLGLDATVVYPTINFRFKNPFDFPIVLHQTVANGIVRAEILGPERKHTVSFFRRIDSVTPFEEVERENPKLAEGLRVLAQRGIPGFRATISRVVRDGAYATREKWSNTYPPTTQIVHVGTGPKDPDAKAHDDNHPEYVADEYLVVTQGPGIRGGDGVDMVETRKPGRTGEYGWTEKAGFSKFRSKSDEGKGKGKAEETAFGAQAEGSASSGAKPASLDVTAEDKGSAEKDAAEEPKKKRRKKKRAEGD